MRVAVAIDLYIGDLARRGRAKTTRASYERLLFDFSKGLPRECLASELRLEDYERFLNRWVDKSPSTLASSISLVKGFSAFLYERGYAPADVAEPLRRPRRHRPEDLPVVTVSSDDVTRMIFACQDFQELICLGAGGYLARRRTALARCRRGDADLEHGYIRFQDKGGKVIEQPIPDEFLAVLREAEQHGVWAGPDDYLIPNRRRSTTNQTQRSSKIVYETVKKVADRAGVRAHVHALRAAFAVEFLESKPDQIEALKTLMGHDRLETTTVYLRRMNRAKAMETVRDLSFGFSPRALEAHTGFEPVPEEKRPVGPLEAKLSELRAEAKARSRKRACR